VGLCLGAVSFAALALLLIPHRIGSARASEKDGRYLDAFEH
jgi:hypothetical protein